MPSLLPLVDMKKPNYDRLFLRFLIVSLVAIAVLTATILVSWFFNIDIHSIYLWIAAAMAFSSASMIYTAPFYWKIATVFVTIIAVGIFISSLFAWALFPSLLVGMAVVIGILLTYISL